MAMEVKIKELSMSDFVLGENNQVQKVSLKSETMREKTWLHIYRELFLIPIFLSALSADNTVYKHVDFVHY